MHRDGMHPLQNLFLGKPSPILVEDEWHANVQNLIDSGVPSEIAATFAEVEMEWDLFDDSSPPSIQQV